MDRYELAWAAGFFDGEGWANAVRQKGRNTAQPHAQVNQAGSDGPPEVLIRFQNALGGLGRVGGPYVVRGRKDLYRWTVSSRTDVELLHHLLAPWLGQVKLLSFANTLERMSARSRETVRPSDEWRAWAAGLFDGEGSIYLLDHRSHADRRIGEIALTQASIGGVPEVLRRAVTVVQRGHINGPYRQTGAEKVVFRWKVTSQSDLEPAMQTILPWLGEVKRRQAAVVLDTLRFLPDLPRGNPEWGNRKTHCIHGHEYATARLRPFVARAGGEEARDSEQCLQCAREQARARRAAKKSAADHGGRSASDSATSYDYLLK